MTNYNDTVGHILKIAQDIPLLSTGVDSSSTHQQPYPIKEHYALQTQVGQLPNTSLNSMLAARNLKIPNDPKDPHYRDRSKLEKYKANAQSLTFRGHRNAPVPKVEWEQYYLHTLPLIIEHPKRMLLESKQLTDTLRKILRTSSEHVGDASLSIEQRAIHKTKSLCISLVADHPWEQAPDEDDQISLLILEEQGLQTVPRRSTTERRMYDSLMQQYKSALSFTRELLNHTFLRFIYLTSTRQAQLEYKEIHTNFLNQQESASPSSSPIKFTAKHIIDYIESQCVCSNAKSLQSIRNSIQELVRYKGETPLKWYQRFQPYVIKYNKANGNVSLDAEQAKILWKDHFSKQLSTDELSSILTFQSKYLDSTELSQVHYLSDGTFVDSTLQKLLMKMNNIFMVKLYEPDVTVKEYLQQHAASLNWKTKIDFTNPKRKQKDLHSSSRSSSNKHTSTKQKRDLKSSKRIKLSIPRNLQCRNPKCRQKGTYKNHKNTDCIFKQSNLKHQDGKRSNAHPNLGKAPLKGKQTSSSTIKPNINVRRCYICNSEHHLANACPNKDANKKLAQARLKNNVNFMTQWNDTFTTQAQQVCAQKILDAWDDNNLCPHCLLPLTSNHICNSQDDVSNELQNVRQLFTHGTLLKDIHAAHNPTVHTTHTTEFTNEPVSINSNFFLDSGGQELECNAMQTQFSPSEEESNISQEEDSDIQSYQTSDSDSYSNEPYNSDTNSDLQE